MPFFTVGIQEGQIWADLSWSTRGFVVPVMSYNVHELRGYNRLAGMARGKYMVLIQVGDLPNCQRRLLTRTATCRSAVFPLSYEY